MSDHPQAYAFPHRTPVFTAVVVVLAAVLCGWLINRAYRPAPAFDQRGTAGIRIDDPRRDPHLLQPCPAQQR